MSLQTRLSALITAIGADIKDLRQRPQASFEASDGGATVGVPNDSVAHAILRADGLPLGTGAFYTVPAGSGVHWVMVEGQVYYQANSDLWTLVRTHLRLVRNSDGAELVVPGTYTHGHSYGAADDTSRPSTLTMRTTGMVQIPAGAATWHPELLLTNFGGLGGGSYTRAPGYNHVSVFRVM